MIFHSNVNVKLPRDVYDFQYWKGIIESVNTDLIDYRKNGIKDRNIEETKRRRGDSRGNVEIFLRSIKSRGSSCSIYRDFLSSISNEPRIRWTHLTASVTSRTGKRSGSLINRSYSFCLSIFVFPTFFKLNVFLVFVT